MKKILLLSLAVILYNIAFSQKDFYAKSIQAYQKKYVTQHEVVKKADKKYFRFFPVDKGYYVACSFERITDTTGFTMKTSASTVKHYFKYGRLDFKLSGATCHLYVYQSKDLMQTEQYRNYLFVPFTDITTGNESYGSGRYLEFYKQDIQNNILKLDFNKAYNPYCAYSPDYKCPIPPKENNLAIAIKAGEMNFGKAH